MSGQPEAKGVLQWGAMEEVAGALEDLARRVVECRLCPRLVAHREACAQNPPRRYRGQTYWARPVPGFGDPRASVLVVGLAPACHGGNRTGRVFTGNGSGQFLIASLWRAGLANRPTSTHRDDGLALRGVYLTAGVKCAPPANRPLAEEWERCLPYLVEEVRLLRPRLRAVVALGRLATEAVRRAFRALGHPVPPIPFRHGGLFPLGPDLPVLLTSYHPSRQNTQTGRLTPEMMDRIWERVREVAPLSPEKRGTMA